MTTLRTLIFCIFCLWSLALSAAKYRVSVDTYVGGIPEDRFFFELSEGELQKKGFEAKMLSKRYRAKGFDHSGMRLKLQEKELDKLLESGGRVKLNNKESYEDAKLRLAGLERALRTNERRIIAMQEALVPAKETIKELEDLMKLYDRNRSTFAEKYERYLDKHDPALTEADIKARKAALYTRRRADCDEFSVGSYCDFKILKSTSTAVLVDLNYSYSRLFSWFYSGENSNGNMIGKFPIFETFEKMDVKNLTLFLNKPYCFQFSRPALDGAKSFSKAADGTILSGMASGAAVADLNIPSNNDSALNVQGPLSEIQSKFKFDGGKTVRAVITVKKIADE